MELFVPLAIAAVAAFVAVAAWWVGDGEEEQRSIVPVDQGRFRDDALAKLQKDMQKVQSEVAATRANQLEVRSAGQVQNVQAVRANQSSSTQHAGQAPHLPLRTDLLRAAEDLNVNSAGGRTQAQYTPGYPGESSAHASGGADHARGWPGEQAFQPARLASHFDPAKMLPEAWSAAYRLAGVDMVRQYLVTCDNQWSDATPLGNSNVWALRAGNGQWQLMHQLGVKLDENFGADLFEVGGLGSYVATVSRPATLVGTVSPTELRNFARVTLEDWRRGGAMAKGSLTCSDNLGAR